ncbi:MAG: nucleotidyltransferase domain-containing protein [Planctomycetota bacterium]
MSTKDTNVVQEQLVESVREVLEKGHFLAELPASPVFVSITGPHSFGYARSLTPGAERADAESSVDLASTHALSARAFAGLERPEETFELSEPAADRSTVSDRGLVLDRSRLSLRSDDVRRSFERMIVGNGDVFEGIFSPCVVIESEHFDEYRNLARGALTRRIYHGYRKKLRRLESDVFSSHPAKPESVLELFRSAMTAIRVLRSGRFESDLRTLNAEDHGLLEVQEIHDRTLEGETNFDEALLLPLRSDARRLTLELDAAFEASLLPEEAQNTEAIDDFILRLRGFDETS